VTTPYYPDSDPVACSGGTSRYCKSNFFNNDWANFDLEFMEGDTASGMYAVWFKERCTDPTCAPEKTCGGSSGVPITGSLLTTYFPTTKFSFDGLGCYYNKVAKPPVSLYPISSTLTVVS